MQAQTIWILAKERRPDSKTKTGILLSDTAKKTEPMAYVVSVGPDVHNVFPGDVVVFRHHDGKRLTIFDETFIALTVDSVVVSMTAEQSKEFGWDPLADDPAE